MRADEKQNKDVFIFARQMMIGQSGTGYSKDHFTLVKDNEEMDSGAEPTYKIVGIVPVWQEVDGIMKVVSSKSEIVDIFSHFN